jgi:hypothetical protein
MLKTNTVFIVESLQKALDDKDVSKINELMPQMYLDYRKNYALALIDYNSTCDIGAADLINFRYLHPKTPFTQLFCFQPSLVKALCSLDMNLKRVGKS